MSIDNVNLMFTLVSIVVSIISTVSSVLSFKNAKKARQYKEGVSMLKDTMDLKNLTSNFMMESQHFLKQTRSCDWFKGIDVNTVISPFTSVLMSFGASYHLMRKSEDIKYKVHKISSQVQNYETLDFKSKRRCQDLILEVIELLQEEVQNSTKKIIKTK